LQTTNFAASLLEHELETQFATLPVIVWVDRSAVGLVTACPGV
jgi:hypothetical protein